MFLESADTLRFHGTLLRCFLLGLLDAHSELALLSQRSEQLWTLLGQRLANVHLHDPPISSRTGRPSDPPRCPPKRRYAPPSPSFPFPFDAPPNPPTIAPYIAPPINHTHGPHDEAAGWFDAGFDADGPRVGAVGCAVLVWLLVLAVVGLRSSRAARARSARPSGVAVDAAAESGTRVTGPVSHGHRAINGVVASIPGDVGRRVFIPGAWLLERRVQGLREGSVLDAILWTLLWTYARMGVKAWAQVPISIASDRPNRGSGDVVLIEPESKDEMVFQGQSSNDIDLDASVSTFATLNVSEHGAVQDDLPFESSPSIENLPGSITKICDQLCELLAVDHMTTEDPDTTEPTTLEVVRGDKIASGCSLASVHADRDLCREDMPSSINTSEDESNAVEDVGLFDVGTEHANLARSQKKDDYRVLGRQQEDGALLDNGCPRALRRARSAGYLGRKHDMDDDDDETTGEDSFWADQVYARLSSEQDFRRTSSRYGWPDRPSWPRDGREDESDNWRVRSSQVTPEKTSDKPRRYSSPPLNVDPQRAGSGDGPQGVYIVPQKRGQTGDSRRSPVPSPRQANRSSGLGFFPFRETPPLLTPEAWRPGCLYIPDPPLDESKQADAWWDRANSAGHTFGSGTAIQDGHEQGSVSWRNRYENDPASRRLISVHRRSVTGG